MEISLRSRADVFEGHIRKAREAWPALQFEPSAFARHLRDVAEAASEARAADLLLSFLCARADAAALAAFERDVLPRALKAVKLPRGADVDEVRQAVRERLLVGGSGRTPKIATYSGAGSLVAWVATVATRAAIDLGRKGNPELEDADLQAHGPDAELELFQRYYQAEFKQAFRRVLEALAPDDRRLLRLCYLEGLSGDVAGKLLGVHRMTVSRRIGKLRQALAEETRRGLAERLGLKSRSELQSVMRLLDGQLDASIRRALQTR